MNPRGSDKTGTFFIYPTTIRLSQGKVATVDPDIHAVVSPFKWTAVKRRGGQRWYAYRNVRVDGGKIKPVFLHQVVMGMPINKSQVIDHIDGDGLSNVRKNLRIVSQSENITNSRARREGNTHSAFPGVTWHKGKGRWYTSIRIDGKTKFLGMFKDESDAAEAYRMAKLG